MSGLARLALQHARHHAWRTAILVACIAVALFLPATTEVLLSRYQHDLTARAAATPLLAGPRGNRFDLTLGALYFRASRLDPVPWSLCERLGRAPGVLAVPLHARFTARGLPVVGTLPEYYERRGLGPARGTLPLALGDVALGADVADSLGLGPGDAVFSDPLELYDIAKPPALRLSVCGVLGRRGTPDDGALFVDVKTAWVLEGLAHGHGDVVAPDALPEGFVLSRTGDSVAVSPALIEHNAVSGDNVADFHLHGDPDELPLSSVLLFPEDAKAGTLVKAEVNAERAFQVVAPEAVIDDLMAFVFRIKALVDRISAVLVGSTVLFSGLVLLLSARLRAEEFRTLHAIGCGRWAVWKLYGIEVSGIVLTSIVVATCGVGAVLAWLPDLVGMF